MNDFEQLNADLEQKRADLRAKIKSYNETLNVPVKEGEQEHELDWSILPEDGEVFNDVRMNILMNMLDKAYQNVILAEKKLPPDQVGSVSESIATLRETTKELAKIMGLLVTEEVKVRF